MSIVNIFYIYELINEKDIIILLMQHNFPNFCDDFDVMEIHHGTINDIILLSDGRLATCSEKGEVKILNIKKNYTCEVLIQIENIVYKIIEIPKSKLVIIDDKYWFSVWSINKKKATCEHTMEDKYGNNRIGVVLPNDRMVIPANYIICVFSSKKPYKLLCEINGKYEIREVLVPKSKKVFLCTDGIYLFVIDINNYHILKTVMAGCDAEKLMIEMPNGKIVLFFSEEITILNSTSFEVEKVIDTDFVDYGNQIAPLNNDIILIAGEGITVYSLSSGIIRKDDFDYSSFYSLCRFDDNTFYAGESIGTLHIIKYS